MNVIRKDKFYFKFYEKHEVPEYINSLSLSHNGYIIYNEKHDIKDVKYFAYDLGIFPTYMCFDIHFSNNYLRKSIIDKTINGCAIALNEITSIDAYMVQHFKSKYRKNIRRSVLRLESCFNIKHKMFIGTIDEKEYHFLMGTLKSMILNRFTEKKMTSFAMAKWDYLYTNGLQMINEKKAGLSVIYNNNQPIDIALNYHYNGILFSAVSSFDTDYSKFGLGQVSLYKELEWCFKNNYQVMDLTHGDHTYKKNWCNIIYGFENHILYKKKSLRGFLMFMVTFFKVHMKLILKKMDLHILYGKLKYKIILKPNKSTIIPNHITYEINVIDFIVQVKEQELVEILLDENDCLKRPVYDFLYLNQEFLGDIKIFKNKINVNTFYIKGKKSVEIVFS